MGLLIDESEFDVAAQEAALMLLLQAHGMVEVRDLVKEVAEVLAGPAGATPVMVRRPTNAM